MELPNVYRRSQSRLHTPSDGQKFEVRTDSLNTNYSFKYFGKELKAITSRSIATWEHFNFLGEYDFRTKSPQDSVGIQPPKIPPNLR
jgi:hypothetical protein